MADGLNQIADFTADPIGVVMDNVEKRSRFN